MVNLRSKKIKNGYSLFLDYYSKGQRMSEYLGLYVSEDYTSSTRKKRIVSQADREKMRLANERLLEKQLEFSRTNGVIARIKRKEKSLCFLDYFRKACSTKLHRTYDATLKHLQDFIGAPSISPQDFNTEMVERFQEYLMGKVSATSVHHYMRRLSIVSKMAIKDEVLTSNPVSDVKVVRVAHKHQEELSLEEVKRMELSVSSVPANVGLSFLFSCNTGLRFSDLQNLTWDNVNETSISFVPFKTRKQKTNHLTIPLTEKAKAIMEKCRRIYPSEKYGNKVFPKLDSNQNEKIREWAKRVGIEKDVHFHTARHTFATIAVDAGIELHVVAALLGHSDTKQTLRYAKITNSKKDKAISQLDI